MLYQYQTNYKIFNNIFFFTIFNSFDMVHGIQKVEGSSKNCATEYPVLGLFQMEATEYTFSFPSNSG